MAPPRKTSIVVDLARKNKNPNTIEELFSTSSFITLLLSRSRKRALAWQISETALSRMRDLIPLLDHLELSSQRYNCCSRASMPAALPYWIKLTPLTLTLT